jgi:hypothetical protein
MILLNLPGAKSLMAASALERAVVGAVVWNSLFVFAGYAVSILSDDAQEFFGVFAAVSVLVLGYGAYVGLRSIRKIRLGVGRTLENLAFALVLSALGLFVFSLVVAHSLYQEYDALFFYLPLAKSILLSGGLSYDVLHQTVLTTSTEPAVPLMYAFSGFVGGDQSLLAPTTRLIPFAYMALTCVTVYLTAEEISRKAVVGLAAAAIFLGFPVTATLAANYGLYLDVPFAFFAVLILFAVLKVRAAGEDATAWWLVLGISLSLAFFEREYAYFLLPAVVALLVLLLLRSGGRGASVPVALGLAVVFTGAYNLFFLYDLRTASLDLHDLVVRELPVIVVMACFALLASAPMVGLKLPRPRTLLYAACPLAPAALLLARNILQTGSVTSDLPIFDKTWGEALALLAQAGRPSSPSTSVVQLFQWDTLFYDLQIGAVFLIPILIGLLVAVLRAAGRTKEAEEKTRFFIFVSFFLAMLLLWSWLFGSSFAGPEVRRLYYFAPFIAILGGVGLVAVAERLDPESAGLRIAVFLAATVAFFWYEEVGASWNIARVSAALGALGDLNVRLLVAFTAIFVLSFYPLRLSRDKGPAGTAPRKGPSGAKVAAVVIILLSSSLIAYNSAVILSNEGQTSNLAPGGWENDLAGVIQYLNADQDNSYGIVTTWGLPLAYFTPHPIIESTTYPGINSLLSMNDSSQSLTDDLLGNGIHYILVPTPANNFYNFSTSLGKNFSVMNQGFIDQTPNLVLIKSFDKFQLYQVVADQNLTRSYAFLTDFSGWTTLDQSSQEAALPQGVRVSGGSPDNLTIVGDNETSFWIPAKAIASDQISVADDPNQRPAGNDSLRISLQGTGNMVIDHYYKQPQNWSSSSVLSLYFYGANTSQSVSLTFHTNGWTDYFATSFVDNFVGWKLLHFPMDSFVKYGSPNWSSISFIEFLMGHRTATYWIGGLWAGGDRLGVVGTIPPIDAAGPSTVLVASVSEGNSTGGIPAELIVSTTNATRAFELQNGVNSISLPSWYLTGGATVEVSGPALSSRDSIALYYLGALNAPAG